MSNQHPSPEDSPVTRRGVPIASPSAPAGAVYEQVAVPVVYVPDFGRPILHFNAAAREFFGVSVAEERFFLKRHYRMTDPGGLDRGFAQLAAGDPARLEVELLRGDGVWVSAELLAHADPPGDKPSVGAVVTIRLLDRAPAGTSPAEAERSALGAPPKQYSELDTPEQLRSFRDALFASSDIAISVSKDYTKDHLIWNDAFYRLLGLDPAATEPTSQAFFACVYPDDRARMVELGTAIASGEIAEWQNECRLITSDGELRHVNGHGLATFDGHGRRVLIAILIDVTNERRRAVEAKAALADLERMTASVSHDLRAPVRHLESFCGLMKESLGGQLAPDDAAIMSYAEQGIAKLSAMIGGMVEYSRLPKSIARGTWTDTEALFGKLIDSRFAKGTHRVTVGSLPGTFGDPHLLTRLFDELLSNAGKFSRAVDTPEVEVRGHVRDGDYAVIEIADNGAGFEERYAHKLFEMFQRLHTAEEFPGYGIGLAIAQRIVRLHGGRISGRRDGDRTVFTVELPLPGVARLRVAPATLSGLGDPAAE